MPESLGRYELIEKLAAGGFSEVYKARDPRTQRLVAIKTLKNLEARTRFEHGMRVVAALTHANIAAVYDFEFGVETPYVVMELVPGESLDSRLQRGRMLFSESLRVLRETAVALDFVHAAGIVHRDVKPHNVLIGNNGLVKLIGFSIARILNDESTEERTVGTPSYIAPEVIQGGQAVPASDQFSFAIMAFQMLTGSRPFNGDDLYTLFQMIAKQPAPLPTSIDPSLPKQVDAALLRALDKDPAQRYSNCVDFIKALDQAFIVDLQATTPPPGDRPPGMVGPDFGGRYKVIEKIGQGNYGAVYKARDPHAERLVAIKTLLRIADQPSRNRFKREMKAAAALTHPNIVVVHDCDLESESPYIVMELVPGETLAEVMDRQRLPFPETLAILRDIASALDFAHQTGIIHRDVKPANVILAAGGRAKLLDFGVAKIVAETAITLSGTMLGTPVYMAPEGWLGKPVPGSDQFSLAVMAFRLLSGALPFDGDMPVVLFNQIVNLPVPPPTSVDSSLPKPIDAVLLRALSKDPAERYPGCVAFVEELAQAFVGPAAGDIRVHPKDGLKYVWIPPGSFWMGRSPGDEEGFPDEDPRHWVTITKGFWMGQTPVTVAAWKRFAQASGRSMPLPPSFNKGWAIDSQPIANVSWEGAEEYCKWAGLRLPTEAEWEYAARAGAETARYGDLKAIAEYHENSSGSAQEVARKEPNAFGLYDVLGNVWEWVADWYGGSYYKDSESNDPRGPSSGTERALRGGSWSSNPRIVRVSFRFRYVPSYRASNFGFRCAGELR